MAFGTPGGIAAATLNPPVFLLSDGDGDDDDDDISAAKRQKT